MLIQYEIITHDHTLENDRISSNKIMLKKSHCNAVEIFRFIILMNMIFRLSMAGSCCYGEGPWWATHADVFCSFAMLRQGAIVTEGVGLLPKMKSTTGLDTLCDDLYDDGEEIY